MNPFAYYYGEMTVNTTREQIVACLQRHIEPWDPYARIRQHKSFWGEISNDGFSMTPISEIRNPGVPTLSGKFISSGEQTKIIVESRPNIFVYPMIIFLPILSCFCSFTSLWGNEQARPLIFVIPLGVIFVLMIWVRSSFEVGTKHNVETLKELLKELMQNK